MVNRSKWSAALFAFLLFAGGIAVGALGDRYYNETEVKARPSAEDVRRRYLAEMQSQLKLTPEQMTKLEAIMDDTRARFRALRESHRPEVDRIRQEHVERVKAILTPQQSAIYDRFVAQHEAREAHHRENDHRSP
jgi:Spy/CpxP family protein refolding chaperone